MAIIENFVAYVPNWLIDNDLKISIDDKIKKLIDHDYLSVEKEKVVSLSLNEKICLIRKFDKSAYRVELEDNILDNFKNKTDNSDYSCKIKYVPSDDLLFEIYNPNSNERRPNTGGGNEGVTRNSGPGSGNPETYFETLPKDNLLNGILFEHNSIYEVPSFSGSASKDQNNGDKDLDGSIIILDSGTQEQEGLVYGWNSFHTDPFDYNASNCDDVYGHGTLIHRIFKSQLKVKKGQIIPVKVISDEGFVSTLDVAAGLMFSQYLKRQFEIIRRCAKNKFYKECSQSDEALKTPFNHLWTQDLSDNKIDLMTNIVGLNMSLGFPHQSGLLHLVMLNFYPHGLTSLESLKNKENPLKPLKNFYISCSAGNQGMNLNEKFHSPSMFGRMSSTIDGISIPPIPNIYEAIGGIKLSEDDSYIDLWSETNYLYKTRDNEGLINNSIVAQAQYGNAMGTSISSANLLVHLLSNRPVSSIPDKKWDLELMSDKQTRSIL